jgi:glucokinase
VSAVFALAVDVGGTKVEAALVDPSGLVLPGSRFRAPTGLERDSAGLALSVDEVVGLATAALPVGATLVARVSDPQGR